jgi:glycosyltransferase 2 family protein
MTRVPPPDAPARRRRAAPPVQGPGQRRDDSTAGRTTYRPAADRTRRHTGTTAWRVALDLLADPQVRLGAGAAGVLITANAASAGTVGRGEARAFRAVNGLPDSLYLPLWLIMQFGALGAVPAVAGAAWLAGDRRLAARLLADGTATWALAKLVKRNVQRPRPAMLLAGAHGRGRPPAGLGYLSGHAGVATALGAATLPHLSPAGRAATLGVMSAVALSRVYVGAHLPLDIAGGIALGIAVDAAAALRTGQADSSRDEQ